MRNVKKTNDFEDKLPFKAKVILFFICIGDFLIGCICMPVYFVWKLFHKKQEEIEPEEKEIKIRNYKAEVYNDINSGRS